MNPLPDQIAEAVRRSTPDDLLVMMLHFVAEQFPPFAEGGPKTEEAARRAKTLIRKAWDMRTKLAMAMTRCVDCRRQKSGAKCEPCQRIEQLLNDVK